MEDRIIQDFLNKYQEYDPRLAEAISQIIQENKRRKNAEEGLLRIMNMFSHEAANEFTKLGFLAHQIEKEIPEKPYGRKLQLIYDKLAYMRKLFDLQGLSKEDLRYGAKEIDLVEMGMRHAEGWEEDLERAELTVRLGYNKEDGRNPTGYFDESVINTIWSTLMGNCINYALKGSEIRQGIRIKEDKLEIIMENTTNGLPQRSKHGLSQGKGFPFVENIVKNLDGEIGRHDYLKRRDYSDNLVYGIIPQPGKPEKRTIFGIKLILPKE